MRSYFKKMAIASAIGASLLLPHASAQTVLRYSNFIPPTHILRSQVFDPWIANVEKVTAGRVKIEMMPKVVGAVAGQYDVVRDGLADIAVVVPSYSPGRFDLSEIVEIPFMGDRAELVAPVFHNFYTNNLLKYGEFSGTHVLSIFTNTPPLLFTAKRVPKSADDFRGMKLRTSSSSMAQSVTLLGGVPVIKPVTEIYEMVSSGLVDGGFFPAVDYKSFKLTQTLPKATFLPSGISCSAIALIINDSKWQSISPADREAMMKISGQVMARAAGKAYDEAGREVLEDLRNSGGSVETVSPQMLAELKQKLLPVEKTWIEKARKKGLADPEATLQALRTGLNSAK
jgi:TRAP-type C4-dicarboxylate transport system substrate-binding protein